MNRYMLTLLVPHEKEILAADIKEAGREGTRIAALHNKNSEKLKTIVRSIVLIDDEPEPIDFGFITAEDIVA